MPEGRRASKINNDPWLPIDRPKYTQFGEGERKSDGEGNKEKNKVRPNAD